MPDLPDVSTLAIGAIVIGMIVIARRLYHRKMQRYSDERSRHRDKLRNE